MKQLIVATANKGKFGEIEEILKDFPLQLSSLHDIWDPVPQIPETGNTFFENACIKADWVFSKTSIWTLADDSGLEVDALNGEPGVRSARYAGEHSDIDNNNKLLKMLSGVPPKKRSARFRCVIVIKTETNTYITAEGCCEGTIAFGSEGSGGFGYDPLFIPKGFTKTFAQIGQGEKNIISHRAKALNSLREKLHVLFEK
ncbi:MAG: RdgB/HAM1 family non-canonical purine NTP pyrophosphatase [Fibrobacter sp.]|nr:RdgB/HAM1 family non-canonical purine NTP pyrophosphatase [Fibrobacter sp.]